MKKIILVATICVAGLASAKSSVDSNVNKSDVEKPFGQICTTISIPIWCTGGTIDNSYCWQEGDQQSFDDAIHCFETEYQMFNEELC